MLISFLKRYEELYSKYKPPPLFYVAPELQAAVANLQPASQPENNDDHLNDDAIMVKTLA